MVIKDTAKIKQRSEKGSVRVFVYGTLKMKKYNNILLREHQAQFLVRDSLTLKGADFVDFGGFPAIVRGSGNEPVTIHGEIWYGDEEMLNTLDILEGHPTFFMRQKTRSDLHNKRVWYYSIPEKFIDESEELIETGMWRPEKEEEAYWATYYTKLEEMEKQKGKRT